MRKIYKKEEVNCVLKNLFLFLKSVSESDMLSSDSDPSMNLTSELVAQRNINAKVNKEAHNIS